MFASPDNGNAFAGSEGAPFLVAGLMEVATEIENFRAHGKPQETPPGAVDGDEGPSGAVIGAAFAMGALLPLLSQATSLGLGAALKLLLFSVSLAPVILPL